MNVKSVEKHDNSTATLVLTVEKTVFQNGLDKEPDLCSRLPEGQGPPPDRGGHVRQGDLL